MNCFFTLSNTFYNLFEMAIAPPNTSISLLMAQHSADRFWNSPKILARMLLPIT